MSELLWQPTPERAAATQIAGMAARQGFTGADAVARLWQWSVDEPDAFWREVWDGCGVVASRGAGTVLENPTVMPGARWFPEARLNFAENLLRRRDGTPAIVFRGEDGAGASCPGPS